MATLKSKQSMTSNQKVRDALTNSAATISVGEPTLMSRNGAPKSSVKVQIGKRGMEKVKK
ncbi:hypothetical protein [Ralstonia phage RSF1]|uniref:Uncharacterized protein n=1 Tax=Ralstonia phage RSF1 TaxID=1689679 RepID=A0A0K2QR69_9CAUD|nr:hypothetical protein AVU11_gp024 [Ralstonia phage RSF1]BAS04816.1 hypothetical protein [Ralstonia phage RSF1]